MWLFYVSTIVLITIQCIWCRPSVFPINSLIINNKKTHNSPLVFAKRVSSNLFGIKHKNIDDIVNEKHIALTAKNINTEKDDLITELKKAIKEAYKYLSYKSEAWDYLGKEDGIEVWRLSKSIGKGEECSWPCIKSIVTINMTKDKLLDLLVDSSKIQLINRYSTGRVDVEVIDKNTKVVWNKTKIPYTLKPYDFCSLMHCCNMSTSSTKDACMIVSRSCCHPNAPIASEYSRSEVLVGVNVLTPCDNDPSHTELMTISRVKYGGVPSFLVWQNAFKGTITYLNGLKQYSSSLGSKNNN